MARDDRAENSNPDDVEGKKNPDLSGEFSSEDFERDMGLRTPDPSSGTPWIGGDVAREGGVLGAFPGTGTSIPQDIGAGGFQVEAPADEERDDPSFLNEEKGNIARADAFDTEDLNMTAGVDGFEAGLMTLDRNRTPRPDPLDEGETSLDERESGEMGVSAEVGEFPVGSENTSPGEMGRYVCPNCGFEYDVVVGTAARCPECNHLANLADIIGDESFHWTMGATDLE